MLLLVIILKKKEVKENVVKKERVKKTPDVGLFVKDLIEFTEFTLEKMNLLLCQHILTF